MNTIYTILAIAVIWWVLSRLQKFWDQRKENEIELRIESRINGMSENERLGILNSDVFKKWMMEQWDMGMPDSEMEPFKLLKNYIRDNFSKFF
jgi:hypothetical protein